MIFEFSIGGHFGDSFSLELQGETLCCDRIHFQEGIFPPAVISITGNNAWQALILFLSTRKWKNHYSNFDTEDGTQWELNFQWNNNVIQASGSNMFPPGFKKFLRLLNKVTEEYVFIY